MDEHPSWCIVHRRRRPLEPALASLITVMNHTTRPALLQRHVQCCDHQLSSHLVADGPTHNVPTPDIQHDGQIDEACPGRHIRHVGNPELIRTVGDKRPLDQIRRLSLLFITSGRYHITATSADAPDAMTSHQTGHTLALNANLPVHQLRPNAGHPVGSVGSHVDRPDLLDYRRILDRTP